MVVREEAGLRRANWPVTLGVPLPRDWSGDAAVHVADAKGKTVPTQSRVLAYWPGKEQRPRWLLLDFPADLEPHQTRQLYVHPGAGPASKAKVAVRQQGADVEIDSGALRVLAGRGSGGFFRLQSLAGKAVQAEAVRGELESGAQAFAAGPVETASVEEQGPERASVVLTGRYGNGFSYQVRLQAYAGQPYVRVQHTFIDENAEATTPLRRLSVHVPAPGKGGERSYSARLESGRKLEGPVEFKGVFLAQLDASTMRRNGEKQPGKLAGWFELRGSEGSIGLDVPFFWQEFPQEVRFAGHGLTYDLWADTGEGSAAIGTGAAKTHEFVVVFGKGADLVKEPGRGVVALADPAWTAASGALLNAVDPGREAAFVGNATAAFGRTMQSIDAEVWDEGGACPEKSAEAPPGQTPSGKKAAPQKRPAPRPQREIRRVGAYGMLNWGDWNYRGYHDDTKGCDAWGNQEYDLTQALGLLFAATGRGDVRRFLTAAARHFGDVDVIHYQAQHSEWVGMNHPKNPEHFSFAYGGVDLGHTWVEGLFTYHFLTGDRRALDAAVGISEYLVRRARTAVKGNPRQFGWPALALAAAYEATAKDAYRTAAADYARLGIERFPVPERLGKDWKLGVLADAVSYVHAINGDSALRAWLTAYAAAVMKSEVRDVRYYPAVAYVGRLTGDVAMQEAARSTAARIDFGDWAKPFTIAVRTGFRILSQVDEAR